jgi:hypothetical protein
MPRDAAVTVQIPRPAEPTPVAAMERRQAELPPRPVELVEATLLDARAESRQPRRRLSPPLSSRQQMPRQPPSLSNASRPNGL